MRNFNEYTLSGIREVLAFPLWLRGLRLPGDVGSIPGLAQWVKDLALLQAVVSVTDAA